MQDLNPWAGIASLQWMHGVLTSGPPGNSLDCLFLKTGILGLTSVFKFTFKKVSIPLRWSVNNSKKHPIAYTFKQWVVFSSSSYTCPLGQNPVFLSPQGSALPPPHPHLCALLGSAASPTGRVPITRLPQHPFRQTWGTPPWAKIQARVLNLKEEKENFKIQILSYYF